MTGMVLGGIELTTEVVRTPGLVLRPFRPGDVDALASSCRQPRH